MLKAHPRQKAFTLTELAIVLGIVGFVLGAIWTVGSAVIQQQRIARFSQEMETIVTKVDNLVANDAQAIAFNDACTCVDNGGNAGPCNATYDISKPATSSGTDFTNGAVHAGLVPSDMLTPSTMTTPAGNTIPIVLTPWGTYDPSGQTLPVNYVDLTYQPSFSGTFCSLNANLLGMTIPGSFPADACTKFFVSNLQSWISLGLYEVDVTPTPGNACAGFTGLSPQNYTTAVAACGDVGFNATSIDHFCQNAPNQGMTLFFQVPPSQM